MLSGQFADRYGRKKPFLISSALTIFITIGTIFTTNIAEMIVLRTMMGILGKNIQFN
jgi:putative MFS transporter